MTPTCSSDRVPAVMTRTWSRAIAIVLAVLMALMTSATHAADEYPDHPDSLEQPDVPRGEIKGPFTFESQIYPGTTREYALYVPAQYDSAKPACVFVVQDGLGRAKGWKLPTVLDNLIHRGDVPVQIGIFISPGIVPAANDNAEARYNRSFEYDAMGDRYARFLIEEILPEVEKSYALSHNPNDRCIAGASSGGIAAFGVAWERPDAFRRVISTIGTFVSLRGGDEYPVLVRKYEPRPIRVFLQDGSNDNNLYGGDWWMANQTMLSALKFSGYDVEHAWGEGGHNGKHSTAIMPDMLKWVWRGYPEPISRGVAPQRRTDLVIPGEEWQLVSEGHEYTDSPAVNADGDVFFSDLKKGGIFRVAADGTISLFADPGPGIGGLMFGADGLLYGCDRIKSRIVRFHPDARQETFISGAQCNDLVLLHNGSGYYTDPTNHRVWKFNADGEHSIADMGISRPNGLITSPDQTLLFVSDTNGRFMWSFQIRANGELAHKQEYDHVHLDDRAVASGADGLTVDTEGRRYLATPIGIQIFDQLGRCHLILEPPLRGGFVSNVAFGGRELDSLYVTTEGKVFRRRIKATGALTTREPTKPPRPNL